MREQIAKMDVNACAYIVGIALLRVATDRPMVRLIDAIGDVLYLQPTTGLHDSCY